MGTTTQKLEYLGTTKSQLKDQINYGLPTEKQITNQTTFRNYVSSIFEAFLEALRNPDTLFTNLPKISGNGTQITLNDTANAPMRITLKASELTQDGTPTPDSPQDIHTISGDNSVVINGKNFISIPSNCVITGGPNIIDLETPIPIGTYIVSIDNFINGGTGRGLIHFLNDSGTQVAYALLDNSNKTATINITSPITKLRLYSQNNANASIGITSTYVNMMVSINGGDYEPYVSQTAPINLDTIEYCKIGDYEDKFAVPNWKNIFSTDYKTSDNLTTYAQIDSDSFSFTCSSTWKGATFTIPCEANTDYHLSYTETTNVNGKQTYCSVTGSQTNTSLMALYNGYFTSFNSGENTSFKVNIGNGNHPSVTSGTISNIMLNKGTTALPYIPYGNYNHYIKINNVIKYNLWELNWIFESSSSTPVDRTIIKVNNMGYKTTYLSNIFNSSEQNDSTKPNRLVTNSNVTWFLTLEDSLTGITSSDSDAEKITKMVTYLQNKNAILYTYLSTPTYTPITGTLETQLNNIYKNMLSYKGTTNVSQISNGLPFIINASAIQDL